MQNYFLDYYKSNQNFNDHYKSTQNSPVNSTHFDLLNVNKL